MKFADLFCGIGGSSFGAVQAGLEPCLMVDNDLNCKEALPTSFHKYFQNVDLVLPNEKFWEELEPAEVLLCSPPCQAFSALSSGNRQTLGRDTDFAFAQTIVQAAEVKSRKLIIIENVPGFLKTEMAIGICVKLSRLGYAVDSIVRDAADFGVPQRRRRSIIIATQRAVDIHAGMPKVTVRAAFENLPELNKSDALHISRRNHSPIVVQRIDAIPKDGGSRRDLPVHLQLACHQKASGYNDVYGRMSWDSQAPTITSGCTNPSKGRFLHPEENRAITLREAARLQTFPDELVLPNCTSTERRARMIGNAFPPKFVQNLIEASI